MEWFRSIPGIVWAGALFIVFAMRTYAALKTGLAKGEAGDWRREQDPEWYWTETATDLMIAALSGIYILAHLPDYL